MFTNRSKRQRSAQVINNILGTFSCFWPDSDQKMVKLASNNYIVVIFFTKFPGGEWFHSQL